MAPFLNFNYISTFSLLIFCSLTLIAQPSSSSLTQSVNINPNFDPQIDLFGDAEIVDGGAHVKLTRPLPSSSGLLLRRNPVRFTDPTSFSTEFLFSISPDDGDGLLLVLVPSNFSQKFPGKCSFGLSMENNFLGVEFDTSIDDNVGDLNANHIGINVGSLVSVAVGNISAMNLVLNSGVKLKAWIDYDASSKRLEVRLSRFGEERPFDPIIAYAIDLLKMWRGHDVFVGLSSSNHGNSVQIISVYSWKLNLRRVPKSMHSLPADPRGYSDLHAKTENFKPHGRDYTPLKLLAGLIFTTGCAALIAFVLLFIWTIFVNRHIESPVPTADIRYERIDVAVEKNADDV